MLFSCGSSGGDACHRPLALCVAGPQHIMADSKPPMTKTLEVVGVGEVEVRPQLATLTLILTACKQSLEECRASIDKRQPYVHHTLYSNQARREDITEREECHSNVSHIILNVTIMATLPAQFVQPVLSTLTEKLSDAVEVEKVVYHHSWSAVAEGRAVAGRRAALEARRRASEMAAAVGSDVGPCLTLFEEACDHLALSDDRSEWCVVETPLRLRHCHAHVPTIIKSRVKASFSLAGGLPKITAA